MLINEGTWSDLTTLSDGRIVVAYSTPIGELVFKFLDGRDYLRRGYSKWLLYLRTAGSANGHVIAVGQDHATGQALFSVDAGTTTSLGLCHGVYPVECIPSGDGWQVYVLRSGRYDIYHVNQLGTYELEGSRPLPNSPSYGFLQCDGGVVKLYDDYYLSVPGLHTPTSDQGFSIGQNSGPDPARLRVSDSEGRLASVYTGTAQPPRILVKDGTLYGTAWTSRGVWVDGIKISDIPWGNDTAQPDIPWTPDHTKHVPDMLVYLEAAATARKDYPDGTGELWLHKSAERDNWGENWDFDKDYIGFVEDRSTGTRMVSMVRPKVHSHTNTTRNRLGPEEILERNARGENLGNPWTLPLAGYTWRGNRVWMPRHFTGKFSLRFKTDYVWWDEPQYGGVWEIWKDIELQMEAEAGYGRFNGHEVFVRTRYGKPDDQLEPEHGVEWNYWGPDGWVAFIVTKRDGSIEEHTKSIKPLGAGPAEKGSFVPARFPRFYPIYTELPKEEKPKERMIPVTEAVARAGFPIPSDIIEGAINVFVDNLLDRDKLEGPARMTSGAWRYFGQYYYPEMARQQVEFGVPGSSDGWGHYSVQAVTMAKRIYDRDQKGQGGPTPGGNEGGNGENFQGRLSVSASGDFNLPGGIRFLPRFASALYSLRDTTDSSAYLLQLKQLGFNGVRVFAGHLEGRNQTAASARSRLPNFLRQARALGLYVQVVAVTDSKVGNYDPYRHTDEVAKICEQFDNTILELANEIGHPTQIDLDIHRLYQCREFYGGIIIEGADVNNDELINDSYKYVGGDAITVHLRRDISPGGVSMPWYHEASRLTELGKIRDKYRKPLISGEPNRVENKDNPVGFAYLLGAIGAGLGIGQVFHSSQARDAQVLTGIQLEAAMAFIAGHDDFRIDPRPTFINGHWAEAPVRDVKWYDPPKGSKAWRIFTFVLGNAAKMLITGSPEPEKWREAFTDFQNGWFPTASVIRYGNPVVVLSR